MIRLLITPSRITILLVTLSASQVTYSQTSLDPKASATQETTQAMVGWKDYGDVLGSLCQSVAKLKVKLGTKNQQSAALVEQMKTHSDFLFNQWGNASGEATPATYFESLEQNVSLLKSVLADEIPEKEIFPLLEIVELDLRIKASQCKLSNKGWNALIVVSVNARKGNDKVDGLEVWFVAKGWAKTESKWKRFAKVTCGTSEKLAPGIYMMWLKGSVPVPIEIGGSGLDAKEVDLMVP